MNLYYNTTWHCVLILSFICLHRATSFNVEGNNLAVKYLTDGNGRTTDQNGRSSSFYGYNLDITSGKRLVIASPKWKSPNSTQPGNVNPTTNNASPNNASPNNADKAEGSMSNCKVSFTTESVCSNTQLADPQPGDNFGLSVNNHGNRMRVCSPSKVLGCKESNMLPGFCYVKSNNRNPWSTMKKKPVCPKVTQKLDIIFVLDGSYSVKDDFGSIIDWTQKMAARFDVEKGINQIGVIQYSSFSWGVSLKNQQYIRTEVKLGRYKTNLAIKNRIGNITRRGTATYTSRAINKTVLDFQAGPRWKDKSTKKVMVVLTDGSASDSRQLNVTANYARSLGIIPFAVGVGNYKEGELRTIATGNQSSSERVLSVKTFSGLESIVKDLSTAILSFALEGSGSAKKASYKMEMGQVGFSMKSSPRNVIDDFTDAC